MKLPPFVFAKKFWEGVSLLAAGGLLLLNFFGLIPDALAISAGVILTSILAVFRFFGITLELRSRGLIE